MTPWPRAALVAAVMSLLAAPGARADVLATPLHGPAPRRPEHPRGSGTVIYTTMERAYIDVGAADGLVAGATVARRAGPAAGCAVDLVAEHEASCPASTLHTGDDVVFQPAPEPPRPKFLPAVVSSEDLGRRAAVLRSAPPAPLVVFKAPPRPVSLPEVRRARWVSAETSWAQWSSSDARTLGAGSLDLSIRDADLGAGITVDVAARAERWVPAGDPRFRAREDTRFYLWQAEITAPISRLTLSAGRVLPYGIPGATVFDGASAALQAGPAQIGVFGGVVPRPDTLDPTTDRATGGAFWSLTRRFGNGAGLRHEGRIAMVRSPELGTRVEATLGAGAWWKAAYLSAEVQGAAGGTAQAPGHIDSARADATLHVAPGVSVSGGYRHTGLLWPGAAGVIEPALFPGRSDAADGWVSWDVWIFRLGGTAGFSRDGASRLDRRWVGPELGIPRLLGRWGGLSAGYLEESGWLRGRSAWTQLALRPSPRYRFVARGSWTHASSAAIDADELGVMASASADLGLGFGVRATVLSRGAVGLGEGAGTTPLGITGIVGLYAAY